MEERIYVPGDTIIAEVQEPTPTPPVEYPKLITASPDPIAEVIDALALQLEQLESALAEQTALNQSLTQAVLSQAEILESAGLETNTEILSALTAPEKGDL